MTDSDENPQQPRTKRPVVLGLVAGAALVLLLGVLGVVAVTLDEDPTEAGPLDPDSPVLPEWALSTSEQCSFDPDRGGLVSHFDVRTRHAGRLTLDVEAATEEGAGNEDVASPHVIRVTVPFEGGRTRKQFDVVVPLSEDDYERGYRECRFTANPTTG